MTFPLRRTLLVVLLALCAFWSVASNLVMAQPANISAQAEIDYALWERTATRADEAITASRASVPALEALRAELVNWRTRFQSRQDANANAIFTVRRQIDALGPAPTAESGDEAPAVADQRQQLGARLAELQEPARKAELAYSRADGLIQGIDRIIRERQARDILEFGPSPLNPAHWAPGLDALVSATTHVRNEWRQSWSNPTQKVLTGRDMPKVVLLTLLGLLLLLRGRHWSRRLAYPMMSGESGNAGRWIIGFGLSMGSLVLPVLGVYALVQAMYVSGLVGLRSDRVLQALIPAAIGFFLARWVLTRFLSAEETRSLPVRLEPAQRLSARRYGVALAMSVALVSFLQSTAGIMGWSEAQSVVILYPVLVIASLLLLRLCALMRIHARADAAEEGEDTFLSRAIHLYSSLMTALAVAAPLLGAVGYYKLAHALMYPSLASLGLVMVLVVLQRLIIEIYVLITGNRAGSGESLTPVIAGFGMVVLTLPLFALIWGARVADLTELWTKASEGIVLGGMRISPTVFFTFAIVFAIGFLMTRLIQGALKNTILPRTRIDKGGRNAAVSGAGYLGIFLSAIIAVTSAGIDLSSLAIVAGALSLGIGFGLQNIVSNFVSGIILLIERPISEGDWIEVGGIHGYVRDISVRSTRIETFDRSDVIVPNADFVSGRVTNYTRGNTVGRLIVPVGVAYGSDTKKVDQILRDIAESQPMVLASPPPNVVFRGFGASSLDFEIRAILRDVNWVMSVHSDINHEIARRFAEENIEVPFPQQDIWLRNPQDLTSGPRPSPSQSRTTAEDEIITAPPPQEKA